MKDDKNDTHEEPAPSDTAKNLAEHYSYSMQQTQNDPALAIELMRLAFPQQRT